MPSVNSCRPFCRWRELELVEISDREREYCCKACDTHWRVWRGKSGRIERVAVMRDGNNVGERTIPLEILA